MSVTTTCTAEEALKKLKDGNVQYLESKNSIGDVSLDIRKKTCAEGQTPYAIVITCSDSRVIPESIFNAGIGDIFVIRVAGNVIDNHQLGSIEYAAEHLGSNLVVVMGHNHCGAVGAAIAGNAESFIKSITDEITKAIGGEKDDYKACCLNVKNSVKVIEDKLKLQPGAKVCGAVYHLEDGKVEFL
ncbi:MAG: carbonic anhydrase [Lachnospiraceae bacterium]|nr:carbonic anhydrase [Lachnospiraceae bacterium]